MRKLVLIAIVLLGLTAAARAQQPRCPEISLVGPPGIVAPGGTLTYAVRVKAEEQPPNLQYVWSVSAGEILSGQGTPAVNIRQPEDTTTLTVTVDVTWPQGCLSKASETSSWLPASVPVKIFDLAEQESVENAGLDQVINTILEHEDNQLYIQVGTIGGKPSEALIRKEREVLDRLTARGVDRSRITSVRVYAENELMRFWRVPPGAQNPRCEECERLERIHKAQMCPAVSVTAPAGIVEPGQPVWFIAEVRGNVPKEVRYNWTVTKGVIRRGQGTARIDVYPEHENEMNIAATVEIVGLPEGCYRVASETYVVAIDNFDPILMYEVSTSKLDLDLELCGNAPKNRRYRTIVKVLEENPTSQAYIIFSHKPDTSSDTAEACERGVIQFFTKAGIDRSRITARRRTDDKESIQFWRVPPGSNDPECEDCERIERP